MTTTRILCWDVWRVLLYCDVLAHRIDYKEHHEKKHTTKTTRTDSLDPRNINATYATTSYREPTLAHENKRKKHMCYLSSSPRLPQLDKRQGQRCAACGGTARP